MARVRIPALCYEYNYFNNCRFLVRVQYYLFRDPVIWFVYWRGKDFQTNKIRLLIGELIIGGDRNSLSIPIPNPVYSRHVHICEVVSCCGHVTVLLLTLLSYNSADYTSSLLRYITSTTSYLVTVIVQFFSCY